MTGIVTVAQLRKLQAANARRNGQTNKISRDPGKLSEHEEQRAYVDWLQTFEGGRLYDHMAAIPNGGKRPKKTAAMLKAEGTKKGYPDILIDYPVTPFHGLRIEFKRADGGQATKEQREWIDRLRIAGYCAGLAYGCTEAKRITQSYWCGQGARWSNGYEQLVVDLR